MSEIANFTLGLIVGLLSMLIVIVGWALMNISGQKSREEGERGCEREEMPPWDTDLQKLDMGEALNRRPDPRPEPNPPDDDVKSS